MFSTTTIRQLFVLIFALTVNSDVRLPKNHQFTEYVNKTNSNLVQQNPSENESSPAKLIVNCGGTFKNQQTTIITPNYPNNYPPNLRCEFIFKSPYVCNNQFHVQFLDFDLELSNGCRKDRLCIENGELLCGQVAGIKVYNTTDGILRITFQSDNNREARGFRLLVTRLPCQETADSYLVTGKVAVSNNNWPSYGRNNSRQYLPPATVLSQYNPSYNPPNYPSSVPAQPPPIYTNQLPISPFYPNSVTYPIYVCIPQTIDNYPQNLPYPNFSTNNQPLPPGPLFPTNSMPTYPSSNIPLPQVHFANYPFNTIPPTNPQSYPANPHGTSVPPGFGLPGRRLLPKVESQVSSFLPGLVPACCTESLRQKRFYLSSPGFPASGSHQIDCLFYIEKSDPNSCRLRLELKYFALGVANPQGCFDDYLEIDGQRICGCRTGLIYTSQWGQGAKVIRVKTSATNTGGFVIDVAQEDCPYRYMRNVLPEKRTDSSVQALVETNSTVKTLYKFYGTGGENEQIKAESTTEGPGSQFLFGSFHSNSCSFTFSDWMRLSVDPLWISRPRCNAQK